MLSIYSISLVHSGPVWLMQCRYLRRHPQRDELNCKPERDEGYKIVELIGTIHGEAKEDCEEVHPKYNLFKEKKENVDKKVRPTWGSNPRP